MSGGPFYDGHLAEFFAERMKARPPSPPRLPVSRKRVEPPRRRDPVPHRKRPHRRPAPPRPSVADVRAKAAAEGGPRVAGFRPEHQLAADLIVLGVLAVPPDPRCEGDPLRVADLSAGGQVVTRNVGQRCLVAHYTGVTLADGPHRLSREQVDFAAKLLALAGWTR